MEYPNLSGDEFKKIVNLIKVLGSVVVLAISLMVSVAIIISYQDVNSMREDLRIRAENANKEIEKMREIAEANIEKTREYSNSQIDKTRLLAVEEARSTAKNRIEEIFRSGNIEDLIARTAEQRLRRELDDIIDKELERASGEFNSKMSSQIRLNYQQQQIASGEQNALMYIDSLRKYSIDENEKNVAEQIFQAKKYDYKSAYTNVVETNLDTLGRKYISQISRLKKEVLDTLSSNELVFEVADEILKSDFLYSSGKLFIVLNTLIEEDVEMFDFKIVTKIRNRYKLMISK